MRAGPFHPCPIIPRAGELMYGEAWCAPLADALGVSARTVQAWASGRDPVPPGVWFDVADLLSDYAAHMREGAPK